MKLEKAVLENGLTVIGEYDPSALTTAAGYFVRTGARDETDEVSGVSHFLEHMLFKGTAHRSAEDVNRQFDEIGADYNAFTGEEYTVYYGRVLPEYQERLVELLTDMMRPALRNDDYDMEKNVILEEIARHKDSPISLIFDEIRSVFYSGHPLGKSIIGTTESISALRRDQMQAYWSRRYAPGNLVLALTGDFDWDAVVHRVKHQSHGWKSAETPRERPPFQPQSSVRVMPNDKVTRGHLALATPGISAQDDTRMVADILAECVGGGEGSRLYWELVDPGLADSASLSHDASDGAGAFFGYASCDPEKAQEVLDRYRAVLQKVTGEGLTDDEIERARRKIASGLVIHDENPRGRLFRVGFDWQYRNEYLPIDDTIDRYLAVTRQDVRNLLDRRPFDTLAVVGLGPIGALS